MKKSLAFLLAAICLSGGSASATKGHWEPRQFYQDPGGGTIYCTAEGSGCWVWFPN